MDNLILQVAKNSKKSFLTRSIDNKPIKSIANYGLKKGHSAKNIKDGEYSGITIMALEDIKPLLTSHRVAKALKSLKHVDIESVLSILQLHKEYITYGINIIYYVLCKWLTRNEIEIPSEIKEKNVLQINDVKLDDYILRVRSDPLLAPIQILEIGMSKKGTSVVPSDWQDKIFDSGIAMHKAMDNLDTRQGKPPVNYCCIYGLILNDTTFTNNIINKANKKIIYINKYGKTSIIDIAPPNFLYVEQDTHILCIDPIIFRKSQHYNKTENIGVLVSRLQKSLRHGPTCRDLLKETIYKLSVAPPYSLPEQQYVRVSGSKQLVWRLFISIIEDVEPLELPNEYLSCLDLVGLTLVMSIDPNKQLSKALVTKIMDTAFVYQNHDKNWDWRSGSLDIPSGGLYRLALENIPMMKGDRIMLTRASNYIYSIVKIDNIVLKNVEQESRFAKLVSYDMHCKPNIILDVLENLPFVNNTITTKTISSYIWEYSSKYNFRNGPVLENKVIVDVLRKVQESYLYNYKNDILLLPNFKTYKANIIQGTHNKLLNGRIAFLLLFGQTVNIGKYSIIPHETKQFSIKSGPKHIDNDPSITTKYYEHYTNKEVILPNIQNCKWIFTDKKVTLNIKYGLYYVNNILVKPFDASNLIEPITIKEAGIYNVDIIKIVNKLLFNEKCEELVENYIDLTKGLRNNNIPWYNQNTKKIPHIVWKIILTKLLHHSGIIEVGPVDRKGKKIQNAIHYIYEGLVLRMIRMLCLLYPKSITNMTKYKFRIIENEGFYHMIYSLKKIIYKSITNNNNNLMTIKTQLWDHQKELSTKIYNDIVHLGRKGFGDASHVGAGKSLSALSVISKIMSYNKGGKGFLILLPTEKLYNTWTTEINKHTENADYCLQAANGSLSKEISTNTIVITTLARFREHPIFETWIFVIIDECLSVQNSDALQTAEALRAITISKYGVLLLSATFFRSRFDKLFYMLKMLSTGLPLNKNYLDSVLQESVQAYLPTKSRVWISNINKYEMCGNIKLKYENIKEMSLSSEKIYTKLQELLYKEFDYISCFKNVLEKYNNKRCLIYADNKMEATKIAKLDGVTRYPDLSGKHVVITFSEGTYGLNNLVPYECMICKPPFSDILPQMKGRLDRPGQKAETLFIEFIIVKDSIEEALLIKMDIANNFYKDYIMPLSKFYEMAILF